MAKNTPAPALKSNSKSNPFAALDAKETPKGKDSPVPASKGKGSTTPPTMKNGPMKKMDAASPQSIGKSQKANKKMCAPCMKSGASSCSH